MLSTPRTRSLGACRLRSLTSYVDGISRLTRLMWTPATLSWSSMRTRLPSPAKRKSRSSTCSTVVMSEARSVSASSR
ncbi:UNVERIFIED_CONTAM: hypothetical protein GTU68_001492 [Idotea baltica]|nr:hypothetical protein [Idotea baltica]